MTFVSRSKFAARAQHRVALTLGAAAAAVALAACGGGGGSSGDSGTASSVTLSGTAATGLALAGAQVDIKCASGSAATTTNASGGYSASLAGASLPCMIRVTGTSGGVEITLHSVAESGNANGNDTSAVANVTPLTELVVAQLTGNLPSAAFDGFGASSSVSTADLRAAVSTVLAALRDAAGIDLGTVDPFKSTLVAATADNRNGGNGYDQALDQLAGTVPAEALPFVVNQVAAAAAAGSGSTVTLNEVMTGAAAGSLANCPVAVSGKYRTIEYTGTSRVHTLDFHAMTMATDGGAPQAVVASATQACEFSVGGTTYVVGSKGAGAFRSAGMAGYFFPAQSHAFASVQGTWNFIESGLNEDNQGEHWFGRYEIAADGGTTVCDYTVMNGVDNFGTCAIDTAESMRLSAAGDGGFNLQYGAVPGRIFGYRSPDGTISLFGTNNASGTNGAGTLRTSLVGVRPAALQLPAVGAVTKYWDFTILYNGSTQVLTADPVAADATTVTAVDTSAGTMTRTRASDSRVDTFRVNYPVEGLRYRAQNGAISSVYQMQMPVLGISVSIDNMPSHFAGISVLRP